MKNRITSAVDLAGVGSGKNRAVGLAVVAAIPETAFSLKRTQLDKTFFDLRLRQMVQPEFLQAGRVDQTRLRIETIERGVRRRVLAGIERF